MHSVSSPPSTGRRADKYLKVRVPAAEYQQLAERADQAGMTVSTYVRHCLYQQRQALTLDDVLEKLDRRLSATVAPTPTAPANNRQLAEILLLTRELAAERNAQILARVAAQLKTI